MASATFHVENERQQHSAGLPNTIATGGAEVDLNLMLHAETVIQLLNSDARSLKFKLCRVDPEHLICVRLALAVASNKSLLSLALFGCSELVAVTVVEGLKNNHVLETLLVEIVADDIGLQFDNVRFAIPEALEKNVSLQVFEFRATSNRINDEIGCAFATALRSNRFLRAFRMDTRDNTISDATGLAMARVLQSNVTLNAFEWDARGTKAGQETQFAFEHALESNIAITHFVYRHGSLLENIAVFDARRWCDRNAEIFNQWRRLASLARADDLGFGSLISCTFRSAVFTFSLPSFCCAAPRWFLKSGWTAL